MDWIRRNLIFFNSKKCNKKKTNEENEKDVMTVFDDEFVDLTGEGKDVNESSEQDACEPQTNNPVSSQKVARKPLNHPLVSLSEAGPSNDISHDEPVQFASIPQKPKNFKKKVGNGHQQLNTQLRNNIIHQPR